MSGRLMVLYEWPYSQICLECVHKQPGIMEESAALCSEACEENDGRVCSSFIPPLPPRSDDRKRIIDRCWTEIAIHGNLSQLREEYGE